MLVDNIVTTNLHHGTCIALQNGKFHEGKKVPKCGLKSTIFHQLLETMQCRKLFKQFLVTKFLVVLEPQGIHPKQQMQCNMSQDVEFRLPLCPDTSTQCEIGKICSILNLLRNKIWLIGIGCRCQVPPAWVVATCPHLIRPQVAYKSLFGLRIDRIDMKLVRFA